MICHTLQQSCRHTVHWPRQHTAHTCMGHPSLWVSCTRAFYPPADGFWNKFGCCWVSGMVLGERFVYKACGRGGYVLPCHVLPVVRRELSPMVHRDVHWQSPEGGPTAALGWVSGPGSIEIFSKAYKAAERPCAALLPCPWSADQPAGWCDCVSCCCVTL